MSLPGSFGKKLSMLFARQRYRSELDEEMAFHRAQAEKDFVAEGMIPEAAHFAAMRQFGNVTKMKEKSHEVVRFRMETVVQDVRFSLRQLRKNPGFAATAILILALGMGASVAIFAFVDAALIKPLPYAEPNRLVDVDESAVLWPRSNFSRADYEDWKRMNKSFESLDVYTGTGFLLRGGSGTAPVPVPGGRVSDGFFRTLGVKPVLGRNFLPGEDRPGGAKIVLLSYATWMKRYGGRPDIVGQSVSLSADNYTVVGVLPREFVFAPRAAVEFWVPLLDKHGCEERRSCHDLDGVARLRNGVTVAAALADCKAIAALLERQYPDSNRDQGASVKLLADQVLGDVRPILLLLLCGSGLLLLIACVNVASLLLVHSESRRREIAVRGALGATPARLVRQFVTEGLLLAFAGCAAGLLCASGLTAILLHLISRDSDAGGQNIAAGMPFLAQVGFDAHTWMFSAAVGLLAALVLSTTPIFRLGFRQIHDGLAEGGRGSASRMWRRLGANLVVVELAVAVVLLFGAGLLGQSFYRLLHVELGFAADHLATVQVIAPDIAYPTDESKAALYREIERKLAALPGVQAVGVTSDLPVQCNCDTDWIRFVGKPFHGEHNEVNQRDASPGYLPALGAKLIRGRLLTAADVKTAPQVVVVNEALVRKYFPGEDPIGKKFGNSTLSPDSIREIVGVVGNIREGALDADIWPAEYESILYETDSYFSVVIRTGQDDAAMLPTLVSALHAIGPNLGVYGEQTIEQQFNGSETAMLHRIATWLVGGFAAVALVLGVVGLYGVIAYSVSQRTREIGVRMALGAQKKAVYSLVLSEAGRLIIVGIVVGLAAAVGAAMLMKKLLFGVPAWDPATLAGVAVVLAGAALLASYFPARRAASVNPTVALRAE
jgi:predicted permease